MIGRPDLTTPGIDEMKHHKGEMKCLQGDPTRDTIEVKRDIVENTRHIDDPTRHYDDPNVAPDPARC